MTGQEKAPAPMGSDGDSESRLGPLYKLLKLRNKPTLTGLSDGVHAGHVFSPDGWKEAALAAASGLANTGAEFSIDDIRRRGIEEPDKPQRWGNLLAVMKNYGLIERVGLQEHRTPKGDGNVVRRWRGTALAVSMAQ